MAQELEGKDQENQTRQNNNKSLLWTVSDQVMIDNDGNISINVQHNQWEKIGIDHIINTEKDIKTSWTVKIGEPHKEIKRNYIMIGIATKHIVKEIN